MGRRITESYRQVLLDEFLSSVAAEKQREAELLEEEAAACRVGGVLDPFTDLMSQFADDADLYDQISHNFETMDADFSGGLNFSELQERIKAHILKSTPTTNTTHLIEVDFVSFRICQPRALST